MAIYVDQNLKNLTEYPNSFKRQGAFPLEAYSVFSNLNAAKDYAENNPIAFVGQPLAVVALEAKTDGSDENIVENIIENTTFYVIGNTDGELIELGTSANIEELNRRLEEVEKFFDATTDLTDTIDTLYELQEFIKEHGQDFAGLYKDVKDIYTPHQEANQEAGTPEIPESGYLVEKETKLREEIQEIYNEKGILYMDGSYAPTGILADEIRDRVLEDEALEKKIDDEQLRAETAEQNILNTILGTDANKENGEFYGISNGILAGIRGNKKEDGTYEYNNIVEYIQGSIPIASENRLGRVLSSTEKDQIKVETDGTMTVNSLNINKLYQTDFLILDGGTATKFEFEVETEEPSLNN